MRICGIYKIENLVNGKVYIGQSVNISKRFNDHVIYLNLNKHDNKHLQSAWNKYGNDKFEFKIIEECLCNELNEKEIFYINKYKNIKMSYNMNDGGYGSRGYKHTDETKKRISEIGKGRIPSEETKQKQRERMLGKKMPEGTGEKIRKAQKGRTNYWCKGKKKPPISEETRKKISESGKGRIPWNKDKSDCVSLKALQALIERSKGNTYRRINFGENETIIKEYIKNGIGAKKIAKMFNVSPTPIWRIRKEMIERGEINDTKQKNSGCCAISTNIY